MRAVWWTMLAFSLLEFLLVGIEKKIPLRTELETEYGLDNEKTKDTRVEAGAKNVSETEAKEETTTEMKDVEKKS